jgi:hypothetical protein
VNRRQSPPIAEAAVALDREASAKAKLIHHTDPRGCYEL